MDKQKILEKLALYYGMVLEYKDSSGKIIKAGAKECQEFLDAIGINTENIDFLQKHLKQLESENLDNFVQSNLLIQEGKAVLISVNIPEDQLDKSFKWEITEESGRLHTGEFYASHLPVTETAIFDGTKYFKVDLSLPIRIQAGYHQFKLMSDSGKTSLLNLISVPEKCYKPLALQRNDRVKGVKLSLFSKNPTSDYKISSYKDITNAINYLAHEEQGVLGINAINKLFYSENSVNLEIPSTRLLFNFVLLDIDEMLAFVDDKNLKLEILSSQYQEYCQKIREDEETNLNEIYDLKNKLFRHIYNSFRENHIKNNTTKGQEFYNYISGQNGYLRKLALFEALQDYFEVESPRLLSWHEWPLDYQNPESEAVILFEKNNIETVQFYEFLQWQADLQLRKAGRISWINKLSVGIYTDLPFYVNSNGAEAWLNQGLFAFNSGIKSENPEVNECTPIIPNKLKQEGYTYFTKVLGLNMLHSGAIKVSDIEKLANLEWQVKDTNFLIKYPFEDILGIIALESHRHKCAVFVEDKNYSIEVEDKLKRYGLLKESTLELQEIESESELNEFFENVLHYYKEQSTELGEKKRIAFNRIPLSAYRIQFNKNFTFKDAIQIIPYLKDLGVSHCYASPLLCPRSNSMHGYDIIDHTSLNPEIGSMEEFNDFINVLHHHDMGLIIDIVPNHMGVGNENKWWMDVLENGQASKYASFFDIDWKPIKTELTGKVLVPILGDHYGNILQQGQFKFQYDENTGKLKLSYWEHDFPVNPSSYPLFLEHRLEVLESRLGSNNFDFLEYLSVINVFKKLPGINETSSEKVFERNREKDIAFRRLSELSKRNPIILGFIKENIIDFECREEDPVSCNRIHNFLEQQAYRLAYWRVSTDIINYRRFFDVNDLIGLNTENPLVFSSTHNLILDLVEQEKIDGLRIDHPDGLIDPKGYFKNLQKAAGKRLGLSFAEHDESLLGSENLPIYVIAEKILAPFENLPKDWAINGTVGYEFLNDVCHVLVNQKNERKFTRIYQRFIGEVPNFNELVVDSKKLIMKTCLTGELNTLANLLNRISEKYYSTRDYTLNSLRDALAVVIACFPVYRTYITASKKGDKAIDYIKWAVGLAKKRSRNIEPSIYDFIEKVLLVELEEDKESQDYKDILFFAQKFQQYTGPLMAKGLEDTTFYRYNRLVALNEVGGEPKHFGMSVSDFHNNNIERLERTPHGFLNTSTHDTKRSEDVRARMAVLSEIPDEWQDKVNKWARINKSKRIKIDNVLAPDRNDEYLFYQTLLGIWPTHDLSGDQLEHIIERIENYMIKAIRESKNNTSWVNINSPYEDAIKNYIRKTLTSPEQHPFWKEFLPFHKKVAYLGILNSITQTALKLTCPGVPDIYQGNELFRFSLVDPDNRRPVDFNYNRQVLEEVKNVLNNSNAENIRQNLSLFDSSKLKMLISLSLLNFRRKHADLFRNSNYEPINIVGEKADNIIAFSRSWGNETFVVVVPRFMSELTTTEDGWSFNENIWANTELVLPDKLSGAKYINVFDKTEVDIQSKNIKIADILKNLPVAVLYNKNSM